MSDLKAKPTHRYLLVEPCEHTDSAKEESEFAGFLIPEEFHKERHNMEPTEVMKVVAVGPDCTQGFYEGQLVLVETRMLENRETPYGQVIWIAENYVPIKFA